MKMKYNIDICTQQYTVQSLSLLQLLMKVYKWTNLKQAHMQTSWIVQYCFAQFLFIELRHFHSLMLPGN